MAVHAVEALARLGGSFNVKEERKFRVEHHEDNGEGCHEVVVGKVTTLVEDGCMKVAKSGVRKACKRMTFQGAANCLVLSHGEAGSTKINLPQEDRAELLASFRGLAALSKVPHNIPTDNNCVRALSQQELRRQLKLLESHVPTEVEIAEEEHNEQQLILWEDRCELLRQIACIKQRLRQAREHDKSRREDVANKVRLEKENESKKALKVSTTKQRRAERRMLIQKDCLMHARMQREDAWLASSRAAALTRALVKYDADEKAEMKREHHDLLLLNLQQKRTGTQQETIQRNLQSVLSHRERLLALNEYRTMKRCDLLESLSSKANRKSRQPIPLVSDPTVDRYAAITQKQEQVFNKILSKEDAIGQSRERRENALSEAKQSQVTKTLLRQLHARSAADEVVTSKLSHLVSSLENKSSKHGRFLEEKKTEKQRRQEARKLREQALLVKRDNAALRKQQLEEDKAATVKKKTHLRLARVVTRIIPNDVERPSTVPPHVESKAPAPPLPLQTAEE